MGLYVRLDTDEEEISEPEDVSVESTHTHIHKAKVIKTEKKNRISKDYGTATNNVTYMQWEYQKRRKRKEQMEYLKQ